MKLIIAALATLMATPALAASRAYQSWSGASASNAVLAAAAKPQAPTTTKAPVPKPSAPYLGLPDASHPKALTATYVGTAKATFDFTQSVPAAPGNPTATEYTGVASATGKASIAARATSSGATFNGQLSNFVANPEVAQPSGSLRPADFNRVATKTVLPSSVPVSGKIEQSMVSGQIGIPVGVYKPGQFYQAQALKRTKDYLPDGFNFSGAAMSPRGYKVGGVIRNTVVNYNVNVTRK